MSTGNIMEQSGVGQNLARDAYPFAQPELRRSSDGISGTDRHRINFEKAGRSREARPDACAKPSIVEGPVLSLVGAIDSQVDPALHKDQRNGCQSQTRKGNFKQKVQEAKIAE
jgi:hypothetical protein